MWHATNRTLRDSLVKLTHFIIEGHLKNVRDLHKVSYPVSRNEGGSTNCRIHVIVINAVGGENQYSFSIQMDASEIIGFG